MDHQALLTLWNLEDMPGCDEAMERAREFLETAGEIVDTLGLDRTVELREELLSRLSRLMGHRAGCDKCNEV